MQFHEIIRDSDHKRIFAPDGAVKAIQAARKAGKVRYIGFTGHKSPSYHLDMLATAEQHGLHFDAVQLPLNIMDAHFDSFAQKVVPILVSKQIGILGMKPFGGGYILKSGAPIKPVDYLHYAMNLPTSVVITGCDSMKTLDQGIAAARSFQPMDEKAVADLLAKAAPYAKEGKHEKYMVSERFDGTTKHPEWLG
jgi:predicted aldo/keto reductase-like oxidoreductase